MCRWGEAFVLGPNINDAMDDVDVRPAFEAISRAKALSGDVTAKVAEGDLEAAASELRAIQKLIDGADMSGLEAQHLPARDVLGVAAEVLAARIAWASGDLKTAEVRLRSAVALQDGIGYMEPPYWYYPVRQSLGAVLLEQGRASESAATFAETLAEVPRNGWALWVLAQAQRAIGDPRSAETEAAFEQTWLGDRDILRLDRL